MSFGHNKFIYELWQYTGCDDKECSCSRKGCWALEATFLDTYEDMLEWKDRAAKKFEKNKERAMIRIPDNACTYNEWMTVWNPNSVVENKEAE